MKYKIILASASERRSRILKECGIPHRVVVAGVTEKIDRKRGPAFSVLYNARAKAERVAAGYRYRDVFVIGADTLVSLGRRIIGKPRNKKEARAILKAFSGKSILVYTGLHIIDLKRERSASGVDISKVHVNRLSPKKIDEFVGITGSYDRAGGFSIEGAGAFIFDNVEGSFYNILGLPVMKLGELFERLGIDLLKR